MVVLAIKSTHKGTGDAFFALCLSDQKRGLLLQSWAIWSKRTGMRRAGRISHRLQSEFFSMSPDTADRRAGSQNRKTKIDVFITL